MNLSEITLNHIQSQLSARLSEYNARLILRSAVIESGVKKEADSPLTQDELRSLSLQLINRGGPGFQIGRELHSRLQ